MTARKQIEWVPVHQVMRQEIEGKPYLSLPLGKGRGFTFGTAKAQAIVRDFEHIKKFVEDTAESAGDSKQSREAAKLAAIEAALAVTTAENEANKAKLAQLLGQQQPQPALNQRANPVEA